MSYIAMQLTAGVTYQFTVAARNIIGYSQESVIISIIPAQMPNQPSPPVVVLSGSFINITWSTPFNQGSVIT